ncbi:hypothetical protein IAD21_02754 [Abditibacteriota bacterium]|nr:hypothetical protein IAD21_02754 [Abditibacteriota bacterium]
MIYILSDLPPVDSVEILRLSDDDNESPCGRVSGELAREIAQLWRQLPYDQQKRCHTPPYALRFFRGGVEVLYSSICWECNNIWITEAGVHKYAEFDARSKGAKRLLQLIESAAGTP